MNAKNFFSQEDLRGAKRWQPGSLGTAFGGSPDAGQAPASVADMRDRAHEEGYRAGYESGAMAVNTLRGQLAQLLASARTGLTGQEQAVAAGLLDLSLDVARQIVRTDIRVKREHVLQVIREAM